MAKKYRGKYHPFRLIEDLNRDGEKDLVAIVDENTYGEYCNECATLVVFNGPLRNGSSPAFSDGNLDVDGSAVFYMDDPEFGPPYVLIGGFNSGGRI